VGGDLRVPPEGKPTGAPLGFVGIFLTATRYEAPFWVLVRRVSDFATQLII